MTRTPVPPNGSKRSTLHYTAKLVKLWHMILMIPYPQAGWNVMEESKIRKSDQQLLANRQPIALAPRNLLPG